MSRKKICLNMIVKNESKVIKRCLDSVKPFIDYWVIVDTGSTDETQEIIKREMQGIPGELHERPWIDFAHNRTEAFRLGQSKADFSLLIDADELLKPLRGFVWPDLSHEAYMIDVHYNTAHFHREILIDNQLDWFWQGVLHEQILCTKSLNKEKVKVTVLRNIMNVSHTDGHRNEDPKKKYLKDAAILERELQKHPDNSRCAFYIGQSYMMAEEWEMALKAYQRRTEMSGWDQELYYSHYMMGVIQEKLGADTLTVLDSYSKAFQVRPIRAEPMARIAHLFLVKENFPMAYAAAKFAASIPYPEHESMFVEPQLYHVTIHTLIIDAALRIGRYPEAIEVADRLLKRKDQIPKDIVLSVERTIGELKEFLKQVGPLGIVA